MGKTRKDVLRIGSPIWLKTPNISVKSDCKGVGREYDVVIVGSGISAALCAELITRRRKTVLVVDRRCPSRGSTPASTAMIQHEIDVPLIKLTKKTNAVRAESAWIRSVRAVNDLIDLTRNLDIQCSMRRKKALYLAGSEMGSRALAAEVSARSSIGIRAEFISSERLREYNIQRTAAIISSDSASANPLQLSAALLNIARRRGAHICAPVEITDFVELPSRVALATKDGRIIVAGQAIFCTGYEFLKEMESNAHKITSTWAIASRARLPQPAWLKNTLVWEASDPYLYFRSDEAGRVIAGGEDEDGASANEDPVKLEQKSTTIANKLIALCGLEVGIPDYVWSAPFGTTRDGLPIIDRVPGRERVFTVMGFGGNGITFSVIASQIMDAALFGRRPDPDADLFRFR